jgi:hypothetical protein
VAFVTFFKNVEKAARPPVKASALYHKLDILHRRTGIKVARELSKGVKKFKQRING